MSDLLWPSLLMFSLTVQLIIVMGLRDAAKAGYWSSVAVECVLLIANCVCIANAGQQIGVW